MTRCPGCLNWRANRDMTGEIAYEVVGERMIRMVNVCHKCIAKTTNEDRDQVFKSVHTYYTGHLARMVPGGKWVPLPVEGNR